MKARDDKPNAFCPFQEWITDYFCKTRQFGKETTSENDSV